MQTMRQHLDGAESWDYKYAKKRWFLDAAEVYCEAVNALMNDTRDTTVLSTGLKAFFDYLAEYAGAAPFQTILRDCKTVKEGLNQINYAVHIRTGSVTVQPYESEPDYTAVIEQTFSKFQQGAVKDYRARFPEFASMNRIEAEILIRVAALHPETFQALDAFCTTHANYLDPAIAAFEREIQFYIAYKAYMIPFERRGLHFCFPQVSDEHKTLRCQDSFDLALAGKLLNEDTPIVCNNFHLEGPERILIVSGPNQGGKTTFARAIGQVNYLASLGLPVPGSDARLFLFDRIFTHFERMEAVTSLRGKLQDELVRMHRILDDATPDSLVIVNEIFASTTANDGIYLGSRLIERLARIDLVCVCVTFLVELAGASDKTVSMVASVDPDDPAIRTYRIERRLPDGLAYAHALARKHELTYDTLKERLAT